LPEPRSVIEQKTALGMCAGWKPIGLLLYLLCDEVVNPDVLTN
jgi:hypothetical protein